jgi:iron complex outermembrane recepter protein
MCTSSWNKASRRELPRARSLGVRRSAALGVVTLAAAVGGGETAFAQAKESAATATALEEIVVTARRRSESLQDTPIAVSVFSAQALENQQISATDQLDQITPNLQFTSYGTLTGNNSAAQVFIRGIGQTDATPAVDPGVGIYIDEVYMGRAVGGVMDFRDIANVQVLRGPQGTLFGRNTIGGAVLLTTNLPGDEFGGEVRIGGGDDSLYEAFGAISIPMSEALGARLSGGFRQRDGYVRRATDGLDLGDDNTYTLQGSLRWRPSDALSLILRADYTDEDEHGSPFVMRGLTGTAVFPAAQSVAAGCPGATFPPPFVPAIADPRCANNAQALGPFTNGGTEPAFSTLENYGASLVAEWRVSDNWTLKSITAERSLEWTGARDGDNTPFTLIGTRYQSESDQFSQELQALLDADRLDGVFGLYYFDEESFDRLNVRLGNPGTSRDVQFISLDSEAWAAFTQWTFNVSDALSLTAGARYTEETKGFQGILFNVTPAGAAAPIPTSTCAAANVPAPNCLFVRPDRFAEDFSSVTGSASIQYRWNPAVMTYVGWSQGFKSGGFNQRYNAGPPGFVPIAFDEENAETFEIGIKANPSDRLRINAAVFTTEYDDIQLTYRLGVVPLLFNAGTATIDGAELELEFAPVDDLLLSASVGYLDDKFDSIIPPPPFGTLVPTGSATLSSELPFTPQWQGHVGLSYSFHISDSLALKPSVNASYTDEQFFDAGNSAAIAQTESITVVNAAITLQRLGGPWRATMGVNNLTDELYPLAGTSNLATASGYAEIVYARPRNYFVNLAYEF